MCSVISYLQSADTVAKFQRLCGVIRIDRKSNSPLRHGHENGGGSHCQPNQTSDLPASVDGYHGALNGNLRNRILCDNQHAEPPQSGLAEHVDNGHKVSNSQASHGEPDDYVVTNWFLYYMFHFGANLGNEIFYMTFFPFWFWNIDGCVGRQLYTFWCIFMYLGQGAKDLVRIPRPSAPPVIQMEQRYVLEYGMPSTHAMVGAGIPFAIFFLTKERYIYPYELALIAAIGWCLLVSCSRVYLGMHSVLDVIVGLTFVSILMAVFLPYLGTIDDYLLHSSYAPVVCILVPLMLCFINPMPWKWGTTRGDTTLILASGAGVALGHWLSYQYGFMLKSTSPPPYEIIPPTWTWAGLVVLRMTIGVCMMLVIRAIIGTAMYRFSCHAAGIDYRDPVYAKSNLSVDLPYKFVTYGVTSIGMVYAAPAMFRALGIERETFFTEI